MKPLKQVTSEELAREAKAPRLLDPFKYACAAALRRWRWLPECPLVSWEDFHQEIALACAEPYSTRFALRRAVDRAMHALAIKSGFTRIDGCYKMLRPVSTKNSKKVATAGQWRSIRGIGHFDVKTNSHRVGRDKL